MGAHGPRGLVVHYYLSISCPPCKIPCCCPSGRSRPARALFACRSDAGAARRGFARRLSSRRSRARERRVYRLPAASGKAGRKGPATSRRPSRWQPGTRKTQAGSTASSPERAAGHRFRDGSAVRSLVAVEGRRARDRACTFCAPLEAIFSHFPGSFSYLASVFTDI